jgi:hypothetical protein
MMNKHLRSLLGLAIILLVAGMSVSLLQAAYEEYAESGATMAAALGALPRLLSMVSVWVAGSLMWKALCFRAVDWADDAKKAEYLGSQRTLVCLSFTFVMGSALASFLLNTPDVSEAATQFDGAVTMALRVLLVIAVVAFVAVVWKKGFRSGKAGSAASSSDKGQ